MANMIPWKNTLGAKLSASVVLMLVITLSFVLGEQYVLGMARRDPLWVNYAAGDRVRYMRALFLANRLVDAKEPAEKARFRAAIDDVVRELEQRIALMLYGD